MSNISSNNSLTKEQLFACLEHDGVKLNADIINKARNHDGNALNQIGYQYLTQLKDYSKSLAWCQMSANQNYPAAYNNIAYLYRQGFGVCKDYSTAMEYYLRAARDNHNTAMVNVAMLFLNGRGVSRDKYKALEWFNKSGAKPDEIEKLNKEGVYLREEDTNKTIYQLINEIDDIRRREKKIFEEDASNTVKAGFKELQKLKDEIQQKEQKEQEHIRERERLNQSNKSLENQLKDKQEIINALKREIEASNKAAEALESLVQTKTNEINLLKENYELKRKLEDHREPAHSVESTNSTNNSNNGNIQHYTIHSDGINGDQGHDAFYNSVDDIRIKIEESEPTPCEVGNKKRRVVPIV